MLRSTSGAIPAQPVASTYRVVNTTASVAAVTIASSVITTVITSPAAAITVTLAAPLYDGERRRIVFGGATTVTWAVTAPATAVTALETAYVSGQSLEIIYNAVAGSPANSVATSWYPY